MRYDGIHNTFMRWGEPHIRPFKGFVVRMLEHINASYPHARHQINNSALDATPAQNALPCLFSHLPTTLHVVILEFGSMAFHLHHAAIEGAARMLLSLNPRPLLIFLSMHEWCQRIKNAPRTLYEPGERLRGGYVYPDTPWARAEATRDSVDNGWATVPSSPPPPLEPGAEGLRTMSTRRHAAVASTSHALAEEPRYKRALNGAAKKAAELRAAKLAAAGEEWTPRWEPPPFVPAMSIKEAERVAAAPSEI